VLLYPHRALLKSLDTVPVGLPEPASKLPEIGCVFALDSDYLRT